MDSDSISIDSPDTFLGGEGAEEDCDEDDENELLDELSLGTGFTTFTVLRVLATGEELEVSLRFATGLTMLLGPFADDSNFSWVSCEPYIKVSKMVSKSLILILE